VDNPTQSTPVEALAARADTVPAREVGRKIPDQYIVIFKDEVTDVPGLTRRLSQAHNASVLLTYDSGIKGFAAKMSAAAAEALRRSPQVKYVEQDQLFYPGVQWQSSAPWGLDRIDQRELPFDGQYGYSGVGIHENLYNGYTNYVHAYVIDTGIQTGNAEFGGRATVGYDALGGNGQDCHRHGTHVAGTIGGSTYGVAKLVRLVAVRVFNCAADSSPASTIAAGVNWVRDNHVRPAVANMSIWGGGSNVIDDAVRAAINAGVTMVVIAGNANGDDACNYSPARVTQAITVAATNQWDARANFSNIGSCVDIFAPGEGIVSAGLNGAPSTESGTSMAAPHVAGAAVLIQGKRNFANPADVARVLLQQASIDAVHNPGAGTPNRLLYMNPYSVNPAIEYQTHVGNIGWQGAVRDHQIAGTTAPGYDVQAIIINKIGGDDYNSSTLRYEVYSRDVGWLGAYGGYMAGTTGESRPLEAIRIEILDNRWFTSTNPGVCYQVYMSDIGWQPEVCNGATAGEVGTGRYIQAIRMRYIYQ
jgi:hypothetical protein